MSRRVMTTLPVRYGMALASCSLALALWLLFGSQIEPSPFPLFLAAVMISSLYGGLGPGLLSTGLGAVASLLFFLQALLSPHSHDLSGALQLSTFVMVALFMIWLNVRRKQAEAERFELVSREREAHARTEALRESEARLQHQTLHDSLTGLPNRGLLHDRVQRALLYCRQNNSGAALLLMDLDRFKEINDTFGHQYGDVLLREVGARLSAVVRAADTVARLGGDEFAVLLPATDASAATRIADRIRSALEQPFEIEGQYLDIEASIGIALYPKDGEDAHLLLRRADVAMYVAKRTGAGHALYEPEQDTNSPDRLTLIRELREAIARDQLLLHYQPKVNLTSGCVEHVEALVRWHHPERGIIPPGQFIPLAEHTGLIEPLTLWVLTHALNQWGTWKERGLDVRVAVNLSTQSLRDQDLPERIGALLRSYDVPAAALKVEITESAVMENADQALGILTRLHEMGVESSLDDFGTGYSSLGYMRHLPVDEIKIDRTFVKDMATNEDDSFIVRTIVDLSHSLGLRVVAEGVEDKRTLEQLGMLECDMAQGYYVSRPLPANELLNWMGSWKPEEVLQSPRLELVT